MPHTAIDAIDGPAFVLRLEGPAIVDANADALAIWGLSGSDDLPSTIDAEMPAVRRLVAARDDGHGACEQEMANLVFWTRRGAQRLNCRCRWDADGADVLLVVEAAAPDGIEPCPPTGSAETASPPAGGAAGMSAVDLRTMAHELRTPIGAVIALADMIDQQQFGPLGDPRYREYARDIRDSAHLALNIVAAALEHDQSAETILLGGIAEIEPGTILRKARRALRLNAHEAGLAIEVEAAPDLPMILANGPGLTQILLNLTANAIKFTPPGGHVTLAAATTPGGALEITVRDTGIGMTELETSVLVEGPSQASALSPRTGDSASAPADARPAAEEAGQSTGPGRRRGIGFSLVRRLAEAMGATLSVTSERGVGTDVRLTFPPSFVIPRESARSARPE